MPPPCLRCDRLNDESCDCKERAELGKEYDEAVKEEIRLADLHLSQQRRTRLLRRKLERGAPRARGRLLRRVMLVTELRDAILESLLPGEVINFFEGCDLLINKKSVGLHISPLKLILSNCTQLRTLRTEGYQLTLISGSQKMLLFGASGIEVSAFGSKVKGGRQWTAILAASRRHELVPCSSTLLPLSSFGCPGREADSVLEMLGANGTERTVTLRYGQDTLSIWMPLREQPTSQPIAVPRGVYKNFAQQLFKPNSRFQSPIYYSHLTEADCRVRGPLQHAGKSHGRTRENIKRSLSLMLEIAGKDNRWETTTAITYELGRPVS